MKPGEKLIRILIQELNERLSILEQAVDAGHIGQRYWRYRRRWITADYERLRTIARRYGFNV